MAELYPYPRFSLAERDRRWRAVRELMGQHNLDVIVTPQNSGHSADYQANTRYLTHCGGGEERSHSRRLRPFAAGRANVPRR